MTQTIKLTTVLLLCTLAGTSQAGEFGYTYIEGGMNHYDDDAIDSSVEVIGSIALDNKVHLVGGYNRTTADDDYYDISIDQYQFGIGTHFSTSPGTDMVFEGSILHLTESDYDVSESAYKLNARIRHKINNRLEGNVGLSHTATLDNDLSETAFNVGGRLYFNENISAGFDYSQADGEDLMRSSIRFGTL